MTHQTEEVDLHKTQKCQIAKATNTQKRWKLAELENSRKIAEVWYAENLEDKPNASSAQH